MLTPFSVFPETQWPAIPSPYAAGVLGMLFQIEQSQWWSADRLRAHQFAQLRVLLAHAGATVPLYRESFEKQGINVATVTGMEQWRGLPLLSRRDIQLAGASLHSNAVPKNHGAIGTTTTGGSTGQPVTVLTTEMTDFFWRVFTLREHSWHGREFSESFAAIRFADADIASPPRGARAPSWGSGATNVFPTGPGFLLTINCDISAQAKWLRDVDPGYVLTYPTALKAIAQEFETNGWTLRRLRQMLTFGEALDPACRSKCERVFGKPLVDVYSSQEVGYIALQCPQCNDYHIQAENVLVEILDGAGRECSPGEVGKIVITTLHNFAMPLIRYDIEDYAEVGPPCPCGRGLPTLRRILGRQRNLLVMPTGELRWPVFASGEPLGDLPPFFQFQVIQRSLEQIDINVVRPGGNLTPDEHTLVERYFADVLGHDFRIRIRCVTDIPRSKSGKFEDFISLVHWPS